MYAYDVVGLQRLPLVQPKCLVWTVPNLAICIFSVCRCFGMSFWCQSGLRTPTLCCGALCMLSVDGAKRQGLQAIPASLLDTQTQLVIFVKGV